MEVLQAISNRRSHRAYKPDQIPEGILDQILTAALQSPSARNHQPWHFSVVQDTALIQIAGRCLSIPKNTVSGRGKHPIRKA